jgi:cobalt-zinc-cadmium efflux system membrane fusion protein
MDQPHSLISRRAWSIRRQWRVVLIVGLLAGGVVLFGEGALRARAPAEPAANPAAPTEFHLSNAQLSTLEIQPVTLRPFRSEELTEGQIALNGDTATQVFSPFSGRVLSVMAGPGEYVRKGTPLLRVDASEFLQGQSDLLNAAAALRLARTTEERRHAGFEGKGGSLQDWQQAQADLAAAQTTFAAAHDRLRILGKTDEQIEAIERAAKPSPVTEVLAPIDGVITDRQVGPGQYILAGSSTPVFTIGDLSTVWLIAAVRETDAPLIAPGQNAEVRVLAFPDQLFKAKVTVVAPQVDPVTHRIAVRATIPNPGGKLKPQMYASFHIITSDSSQAAAVPEEAVVREGNQAHVWVVRPDNALTLRPIRTGRMGGGMVEVLEGLEPGERVVTRGSLFMDREAQPG